MRQVIFRALQQLTAEDLSQVGDFRTDHLQQLVADGIGSAKYYTGLTVSQVAASEIRVASGRYYTGGLIYEKTENTLGGIQADDIELFTFLPTLNERIVAVTVSGNVVDTDAVPRDFLVDVVNEITEPDAVSTVRENQAVINVLGGVESTTAVIPVIPIDQLHVANVYMNINGIYRIEMITDNLLPSTSRNYQNLLQARRTIDRYAGVLEFIRTSLKSIEETARDLPAGELAFEVATEFARISERLDVGDNYQFFGSLYFVDTAEADPSYSDYSARIENGLLPVISAEGFSDLDLLNPLDTSVTVSPTGLVLPKYNEEVLYDSGSAFYIGNSIQIAFTSQAFTTQPLEITAFQQTQGSDYNTWREWWQRTYGYNLDEINPTPPYHHDEPQKHMYFKYLVRKWIKSWEDSFKIVSVSGVTTTTTTTNKTGALLAQTFIPGISFWCTGVDLYFTELDTSGDVEVLVCRVDETGHPLLDEVMGSTTVAYDQLQIYSSATEFTFDEPFFIDGGIPHAILIVTSGQHHVASLQPNRVTDGDLLYSTDIEFFKLDTLRDILFRLRGARFNKVFLAVPLQTASLSSGIEAIRIVAPALEPSGAELNFEMRRPGQGSWYSLAEENNVLDLNDRPESLNLRVAMSGTSTVMPAFRVTTDAIRVHNSGAFVYYSTLFNLPSSAQNFRMVLYVQGYDSSFNTVIPRIVRPDATESTPVTTVETILPGDENKDMTRIEVTFDLGAPVTQFRVKCSGSRLTSGVQFAKILEIVYVAES